MGLTALIISLVALAINVVNHFRLQREIHRNDVDFRILYSEVRGGRRGMIYGNNPICRPGPGVVTSWYQRTYVNPSHAIKPECRAT